MRLIAIILNIVLIGTVLYLVSEDSHMNGKEIAMTVLFFTAPISSLATFYFTNSESWISLYFKRKAMEEKAKISQLNDKNS